MKKTINEVRFWGVGIIGTFASFAVVDYSNLYTLAMSAVILVATVAIAVYPYVNE